MHGQHLRVSGQTRPNFAFGFDAARKHLKTLTTAAVRSLDDRAWVLAGDFGLRLLRVVLLLSLWRILLPETGATSGMTRAAVLTYTLIAAVFAGQLSLGTGIELALRSGDIANRFLRPAGVFGQFTAEMVGAGMRDLLLFSLPLLCLAPLLGVNPLPAGAGAALLFGCSLTLALLVAAALDFIFASIMVLLEHSVHAMMKIRTASARCSPGPSSPRAVAVGYRRRVGLPAVRGAGLGPPAHLHRYRRSPAPARAAGGVGGGAVSAPAVERNRDLVTHGGCGARNRRAAW